MVAGIILVRRPILSIAAVAVVLALGAIALVTGAAAQVGSGELLVLLEIAMGTRLVVLELAILRQRRATVCATSGRLGFVRTLIGPMALFIGLITLTDLAVAGREIAGTSIVLLGLAGMLICAAAMGATSLRATILSSWDWKASPPGAAGWPSGLHQLEISMPGSAECACSLANAIEAAHKPDQQQWLPEGWPAVPGQATDRAAEAEATDQLAMPATLRPFLPAKLLEPSVAVAATNGAPVECSTMPVEQLTARETEVLHLLAQALTDAEIAERLVLSKRTVQSHSRSIYSKLGVANRTAATRYAIAHGVLNA